MATVPKLLDRVRTAIRTRHYSRRTEEAYVGWIRRFILFHRKRHPSEMGAPEIGAYLSWLAERQRVSASTQNQALSALTFLYRDVLGVELGRIGGVMPARSPRRLPVVLTRGEVSRVLNELHDPFWLIAALLYGAGLRLNECLSLRVKDIDFERAQMTVRRGGCQHDDDLYARAGPRAARRAQSGRPAPLAVWPRSHIRGPDASGFGECSTGVG